VAQLISLKNRDSAGQLIWLAGLPLLFMFLLFCLASSSLAENENTLITAKQPRIETQAADLKLLPDQLYFHELVSTIRQAKKEIIMAYFLCKPGSSSGNRPAGILKTLKEAQKRGVEVTVLFDKSGHFEHVDTANKRAADILMNAGITVKFDSTKKTTHVKMAVIDQRYCFIGSHNLTQSALTYNNELSLLIDSPKLAKELVAYWQNIH